MEKKLLEKGGKGSLKGASEVWQIGMLHCGKLNNIFVNVIH